MHHKSNLFFIPVISSTQPTSFTVKKKGRTKNPYGHKKRRELGEKKFPF